MENDELIFPAPFVHANTSQSTRPWTVQMLENTQRFLQADKARFSIFEAMVDGNWHDLTSLWRMAKKHRPIGLV
nr:hypothetical protein [Candidatus Sigynarchaeota archaeon]